MVYNAFSHFSDAERLISNLSTILGKGGTLTVCHGMSRDRVNSHHKNVSKVSNILMPEIELASMFGRYLKVTTVISDDTMFQVCGTR